MDWNLLVVLNGKKRSGKDTAAQVIQEEAESIGWRVKKFAFGDELRRHLEILDPMIYNGYDNCGETWNSAAKEYGYEKAKEKFPEMRRLMQIYGTDVIRKLVRDSFWVDVVSSGVLEFTNQGQKRLAVVTDCRFENEEEEMGFLGDLPDILLRKLLILRDDLPGDLHLSEQFSFSPSDPEVSIIHNNGTKEEYLEKIKVMAGKFLSTDTMTSNGIEI